MSRVDFYILPEGSNPNRFACSITSKALQNGNQVYIHTRDREDAVLLDNLLWTFNDISFIPHHLAGQPQQYEAPVYIGWNGNLMDNCQVLINLSDTIPEFAGKFERIIEIVAGNDQQRSLARGRYRDYRDRNYELHDHKIEGDYEHT